MITFDLETTGLEPDARIVCVSIATAKGVRLYAADDGIDLIETAMDLGDPLVGHNVAVDLAWCCNHRPSLMPKVFAYYEANKIHCTEVREKLLDIADGKLGFDEDEDGDTIKVSYGLGALASKYLRQRLDKSSDSWRTRYGELLDVPLGLWPEDAKQYALADASATRGVFNAQRSRASGSVTNEFEQVKASWCLRLMSNRGMITDPVAVEALAKDLDAKHMLFQEQLVASGLMRPGYTRPKAKDWVPPSRDTKVIKALVEKAFAAHNLDLPRTETGGVSTDRKTLKLSRDPALEVLAEYGAIDKIRGTYLPVLRAGTTTEIRAGFNVLVATGRTSSFKPNFQNLPRGGGVRECFVPRPGYVYVFCDYSAIELRTLAQCCLYLGLESRLAKAFNEGLDPHTALAGEMLALDYQEAKRLVKAGDKRAKQARQAAKALNFGFPGGLGAKKFVEYAADSYGVHMTLEEAQQRRDLWFKRWPEMKGYFEHVQQWSKQGWVSQFVSGRVRGGVGYCDSANSPFQGLASDGIKYALFLIMKACYNQPTSPLYGSKPVNLIHDEIVIEAPEALASEAAEELSRLMIQGMSVYVPDVKIETTLAMARRWYKEAEGVLDANGKLVCWEPLGEKHAA